MDSEAAIAMTDWNACESCVNNGDNGCILSDIDTEVYLGDWVLCKQYKRREDRE
uniref:Uncharacterized protein n=1 Tax=viral metagenome TaxID=1070528 RepID=A0A6M3LDB3_9ZZZZ